jgi:hypothetical protein
MFNFKFKKKNINYTKPLASGLWNELDVSNSEKLVISKISGKFPCPLRKNARSKAPLTFESLSGFVYKKSTLISDFHLISSSPCYNP